MKTNYILSLWLILALLAVEPAGMAQDAAKTGKDATPSAVSVESSISPQENVTLATDVKWTIKVNLPEGYVLPPVTIPKKWGVWTIAASETLQTSPTTHEIRLTLRPTKLGERPVPTFPVFYKDKSGKPGCVEVKSFNIDVVSKVPKNAANLKGMESQNDLVAIRKKMLPYILAALAVMVILIVIWAAFFKRKKLSEAETPKSPYEVAMERIKALMESGLAYRDVKMFCVELTNIVREFIEKTTSINAPELTTEEFLYKISQSNIYTDAECVQLKHFLEMADMVKFAKYDPGEACRNMAKSAEAFICMEMEKKAQEKSELEVRSEE
ncbi:MAG: hypothetical protein IJQ39_03205 [Thermoguttaceae bacterium]|nr:hypothetical protein [Thermoguttaceae bacterium]